MTVASPGLRRHVGGRTAGWAASLLVLILVLPLFSYARKDWRLEQIEAYAELARREAEQTRGHVPPGLDITGDERIRWVTPPPGVTGLSVLTSDGSAVYYAVQAGDEWHVMALDSHIVGPRQLGTFPASTPFTHVARIPSATVFAGPEVLTVVDDIGYVETVPLPPPDKPGAYVLSVSAFDRHVFLLRSDAPAIIHVDMGTHPRRVTVSPLDGVGYPASIRALSASEVLVVDSAVRHHNVDSGGTVVGPDIEAAGQVSARGPILVPATGGLMEISPDGREIVGQVGPGGWLATSAGSVTAYANGNTIHIEGGPEGTAELALPGVQGSAISAGTRAGVQSIVVLDTGMVAFATEKFGLIGMYP